LRLVTLHNLHFYLNLMREVRESLDAGTFRAWSTAFLDTYQPRETQDHDEPDES
jgi:tRNA-guanine family transglycosylase